ncbi:hyaluronidase-5-like [Conger conger]|uniref:hyaluronidase-5-like n=1 Tax=Conger conger TaxID=82655 RepID=UPI002A5ACB94|nr:hyaluronidase-5-like [Conger conger]XP_061108052.1 hyaluronidase-5-like [Conger conger]
MKMLCINRLSLRECLIFLVLLNLCGSLPKSAPPLKPNFPFAFMWNAPSELCESRFGISLDLRYAQLVSSTLKDAANQSITIFYTDRFGIFPYLDEDTGKAYSEGLPQHVDFKEHRELAEDDIEYYIPVGQPGLAILDFEEWRPQWARNWGSKDIYRDKSIDKIMQNNLSISYEKAEDKAIIEFEAAAKKYFMKSINLGKKLRPKRLWGYYLYPDCYNYDYNQDMIDYTGKCPEIEKDRNDELLWLWEASTALYPSIYLELILKGTRQAALFVRHRIQESMRVSMLPNASYSIPIYAYIRIVYKDNEHDYLSMPDLVSTIGEAAALGAAGVVSWGGMDVTESEDTCFAARRYLEKTLNPYILNITTAASLCSKALCRDKGRCVRKNWDSEDYLHLDPSRYRIKSSRTGELSVKGDLSQEDIDWFDQRFNCLCYIDDICYSPITLNTIPNYNFVRDNGVHLYLERLHFLLTLACLFVLS